jgi:hypothetical protein
MGGKPVMTSLLCSLISSVETSINPGLGYTQSLAYGVRKRNKNKEHKETEVSRRSTF